MITQWRTLDLDVLLTPMLGPAMDLNAPGKASGEACFPTMPLRAPLIPSLLWVHPCAWQGCWEVDKEEPWGRIWLLGDS